MKTCLLLSLLTVAVSAHAAVLPAQSTLKFQFTQMGVAVEGGFSRFKADLKFDPAAPQNGEVAVNVDLSSVNAGGDEASDEVKKAAWFDTKRFATASFSAKGFAPAGANRYTANGELLLKGRKQALSLPFSVTPAGGGRLWVDGKTRIRRLAFGIGTGEWEDTGAVADDVEVKFRLLYQP